MATSRDSNQLDYVRRRIPDARLTDATGSVVTLRDLARERAVVLLHVPQASPLRAETLRRVEGWAARLSRVGFVTVLPDAVRASPPPGAPADTVFDPTHAAAESLGVDLGGVTAVLLGTDGLLAGGPVAGLDAIEDFIRAIGEAVDDPARGTQTNRTPIAISCKCITYGRVGQLEESLGSFLLQEYTGPRELLIVNDYPLQRLHFDHPDVRIINLDFTFRTIGEKENFAVSACRYDTIAVWDDDDIALSNHLANIDRSLPGHDLLHWQRGAACVSGEIKALGSLGNSGIVYGRRMWDEVGGHPHENAGYDVTFVNRLLAAGAPVALASPPPREVSWFYMWGNGSYHMSGLGTDDGSRPDVVTRHADHIESQRQAGQIPTGDITLRPRWRRDYRSLLDAFCDEQDRAITAAQPAP